MSWAYLARVNTRGLKQHDFKRNCLDVSTLRHDRNFYPVLDPSEEIEAQSKIAS